jgi:hypothetical protein
MRGDERASRSLVTTPRALSSHAPQPHDLRRLSVVSFCLLLRRSVRHFHRVWPLDLCGSHASHRSQGGTISKLEDSGLPKTDQAKLLDGQAPSPVSGFLNRRLRETSPTRSRREQGCPPFFLVDRFGALDPPREEVAGGERGCLAFGARRLGPPIT